MALPFSNFCAACLTLLLFLSLSSFSLAPAVQKEHPPTKKTTSSQRESRLQKRYNRLYQRFDNAKNSRQQRRLQQKIRHVEQQQNSRSLGIFGSLGMIFGFFNLVVFSLGALVTFSNLQTAFPSSSLLISLVISIAGLLFSLASLLMKKRLYEEGASIVIEVIGLVINSLLLIFLLIIALTALFT